MAGFSDYQLEFIKRIAPHALEASQATGIDPRIIIGQAAVESNYGRSAPGNNYFGIKGPGQTFATTEYGANGAYRTKDSFRTYNDIGDSVKGYANFINSNGRYKDFKSAGNFDDQLKALQKSGYATDPNYSNTVGSVARRVDLEGLPPISPVTAGTNTAAPTAPAVPMGLPTFAQPQTTPQTAAMVNPTNSNQVAGLLSKQPDFNFGGLMSSSLGLMQAGAPKQTWQPTAAAPVHRPQDYANLFSGLLG